MDSSHHRTWPLPASSPPPFSSRPHLSAPHSTPTRPHLSASHSTPTRPHMASSQSHRRHHPKKHKHKPAQNPSAGGGGGGGGRDFAGIPPELLQKALAALGGGDVASASKACRAWRDSLQPLREAAGLHARGRRLKHGAAAGEDGAGQRLKALGLFRRAARLGSAAAMVDAGLMCWEEGRRKEAVGLFEKAAELGHPVGMCNLGVSYLEADPPKAEEAVRWFYPAAFAGNARAQYNLGLCLQNGRGIKRSQREAAKWYLRAAEGGNIRAMYNTSLCYCSGEGLAQDPIRAKKWLQLAADCGHKKALYECGIKLCSAGDKVNSVIYLELATRRGETAASHMRDVILESLSLIDAQRALSAADKWQPILLSVRN